MVIVSLISGTRRLFDILEHVSAYHSVALILSIALLNASIIGTYRTFGSFGVPTNKPSLYGNKMPRSSSMDRTVWSDVARFWYSKTVDKNPNVRKLYHHLAVLARPYLLQQLSYYARSFRKSQSEHYEPFHAHSDRLRVSVSLSLVLWNNLHQKSQIFILREFFRRIWYNRLSDQKNFIWQIYRKIHDQIQKIRCVRDYCIRRRIFFGIRFLDRIELFEISLSPCI